MSAKVQDSTIYSQKKCLYKYNHPSHSSKNFKSKFFNLINNGALISQPPSKIFSVKEIPELVIGKYKVEF
jgi:hypothetical protein